MSKNAKSSAESSSGDGGDARFDRFRTDPKFRGVPSKKKKVKIDARFAEIFDKKSTFAKDTDIGVDKRGRPLRNKAKAKNREEYKKLYRMGKNDDDSDSDSDDSDDQNDLDEAVIRKLRDPRVDIARGEGTLFSDSSSEEEARDSSDDEEEDTKAKKKDTEDEEFDKWGELDHDAERTTEEATRRMAVCNMDWDRVGAEDIFIAMSSFCPAGAGGGVTSVKVYLSDFGRKRKAEEDRMGPEELRGSGQIEEEKGGVTSSEDEEEDQESIDKKAMERIRKYQVARLKYYYAVVEFGSTTAANKVYEECDGTEYELSATRFDLRFIPDDMGFDEMEPEAVCNSMPDPDTYKAKEFETTALTLAKVELTWDETDPERKRAMRKAFEDDGDEKALSAYVAMSSDEEAEPESKVMMGSGSDDDDDDDAVEKYRALLADITHKEKKGEDDKNDDNEDEKGNMEISWGSSQKVLKETEDKAVEKMTPWEQYLHKKKEKRKAKRESRKQENNEDGEGEDQPFSDDELPDGGVDFDDPFFKDTPDESKTAKRKRKREEMKKKREDGGDDKDKKDLSLLVMEEDEDERKHFDYKDIVANESKKGKKKKGKGKKSKNLDDDATKNEEFSVDLKDDRFQAVFQNPDFNVDPSDPRFKKTKSMQDIVTEKQRRIMSGGGFTVTEVSSAKKKRKLRDDVHPEPSSSTSNLDTLVKAVKSKTKRGKFVEKPSSDMTTKKKKGKKTKS